jgi:hydroxymethylglutaryl-CoA reductase
MDEQNKTSRIPGFYQRSIEERVSLLESLGHLSPDSAAHLLRGGGLEVEVADVMSENVVGTHGLPLSLGLNFRVNGRDFVVPMAVEEPSVVAAASNAARLVRISGGFVGEADAPVMTTQIQLDAVPDVASAPEVIASRREELIALADASIPRMVARGGGCRDLDVRILSVDEGMIVVHLYVDVGDAMGANIVDTVAEAVAPRIAELVGGRLGLRILSNLPTRRRVRVRARASAGAVGGEELADGIVRASRFAELDPFRAVTHNKGTMNGIDAVAVALGQDFRSIEAGAHAWAALGGGYRPLSIWRRTPEGIEGTLELPLAVGTVGGSSRTHRGVRIAFDVLRVRSAGELAIVMASVGLASNLAALKALAGEGIQKGHMRLHERRERLAPKPEARKREVGR